VRRLTRQDEDERARRLGLAPATPRGEPWPAPSEPARIKTVLLRVVTPDREGSYRVETSGYYQAHFALAAALYDDGTHGDERSGDGVHSSTIEVPGDIRTIQYLFHRGDQAEIVPLPPLRHSVADRLLPVPGDVVGPVDVFGERVFMAEGAHPNREGHRVVATRVADRVGALPSFGAEPQTGAAGPRARPRRPTTRGEPAPSICYVGRLQAR
jgi:hypothetical protein